MPSSYTISCRFTLQATGENNNTWGVILNNGVFGLVDTAIAGRLAFTLSGTKTLTTANGATDEARNAFLDVTGGSGGQIVVAAVSKGYFVRNAASGNVTVSAGGAVSPTFAAGDVGPAWTDGANVYGLQLGGKSVRQFVTDGDQAVINYVDQVFSGGSPALPGVTLADVGDALMVRNVGGVAVWKADPIQAADVVGLASAVEDSAVAFALTL